MYVNEWRCFGPQGILGHRGPTGKIPIARIATDKNPLMCLANTLKHPNVITVHLDVLMKRFRYGCSAVASHTLNKALRVEYNAAEGETALGRLLTG